MSSVPSVVVEDIGMDGSDELMVDTTNNLPEQEDRNSLSPTGDADGQALHSRVEQLRLSTANGGSSDEESLSGYASSETEEIPRPIGDVRVSAAAEPVPDDQYQPPGDVLADRLARIVDDYFKIENILYDNFLLKHVLKQKEGYVNLRLIVTFKRFKKITNDYRDLGYSVRLFAEQVVLSDDGKRVKRRNPLPPFRSTVHGKSCILVPVSDLGQVVELTVGCGQVEFMRLSGPNVIPSIDVRKIIGKHVDQEEYDCALVTFEHHSSLDIISAKAKGPDWPRRIVLKLFPDPREFLKSKSRDSSASKSTPGTPKVARAKDNPRVRAGSYDKPRSRAGTMDSDSECDRRRRARSGIEGNWREAGPESPASSPGVSPGTSPRAQRRNAKHGKSPLAVDGRPNSGSPSTGRKSDGASPATGRKANGAARAVTSPRVDRKKGNGVKSPTTERKQAASRPTVVAPKTQQVFNPVYRQPFPPSENAFQRKEMRLLAIQLAFSHMAKLW